MIAMHDAGKTPLEIMQEAYAYQHTLAKEIEPITAGPTFFADLNARFDKKLLQV
jgi:hypothetical protein